MTHMRFCLALAVTMFCAPAWAAQCVQVTFKDVNGLPVATEKPLVGFVLPEISPIVDYTIPAGVAIVAGAETSCPDSLVKVIRDLFDANCLTDEARKTAATTNTTDAENVNKRCKDIYNALNPN